MNSTVMAATPETEFWHWFQSNEKELYDFEKNREPVFGRLNAALVKINPQLTFEFGPKEKDGKRDFVISAGGIQSAFASVETLYAAAPKLDRWTIIKFRPRRNPINDLSYSQTTIKASEVYFLIARDKDLNRLGITLFLPGYRNQDRTKFATMGFLFLDEALGEYDVETKVGGIAFEAPDSTKYHQAKPLAELPESFDEHFKK
jgi:hypothetical protein